ncbi:MAG: ABC transporter ATP-binding protein [Desulfurococcaceae archaeon]|nr:ABC transporter ATP-binding protein [Desulfurococcaceae archaeon]
MSDEPLIRLLDVWKIYRIGKLEYPALRGVSLDIYKGEFLSIIGPSGSGKTTLLNLLGALDRPTKGEILFEKISLNKLSPDQLAEFRNKKIGFVFQSFNLLNHLTVVENVEIPMMVLGVPPKIRREKALKILGELLPEKVFYKRPIEISSGEQQRVAIARALANDPDVILADEPTGNLDSSNAHVVMRIFRKLRDEGKTIVMVTHNQELNSYADRVVRLRDGQIVEVIKR